ncbi:MAG: WD40/YVTN/BNR-like repeat-containing protein, partial [Polyangiales bacterium]
MSLRRALILAPLVVVAGACGPSPSTGPSVTPKPPPPAPIAKPLVPESPARWVFHTPRASALRARMAVEGGVLFGGVGGERWLDRRDGSLPTASTALLPEPVVGLAHGPGDKGVLVVGASGAIHVAKDPLGAFDSEKPGPPRARAAAAGNHAVIAIVDGGVVRTTDAGATWTPVSLPGASGTLVDVAMSENGLGLALFAPQHAFATQDDGATWQALPTPGVGARRLLVDANGDLVIEGLEASAVLRTGPLRLDRMAGAPRPLTIDAKTASTPTLGLARAIAAGRAIVLGDKYFEVIPEPDDPSHWRYVYGAFGTAIEPKKLSISPCDRVWVAGTGKTLHLACDDRSTKKLPIPGSAPPPPSDNRAVVRLYRSDDEGKTWTEDGMLPSRRADAGRLWLSPDGALAIDGACKRVSGGRECTDQGPVIRNPGQKAFAKIGLPRGITQMVAPAFDAARNNAFSLGRNPSGSLKLLVSNDGGRDFRAIGLPSIPSTDGKSPPLSATHAEPGSVTVDPATGTAIGTARINGEWIVYTTADAGVTVRAA